MYNILLADDEMLERNFIKKVLSAYPDSYTVVGEVENGCDAVSFVETFAPDVVILDICMPECDGLTSAKKIKEINPRTIIIINTAYADFDFARKAVEYGVDDYLLKPVNESGIIESMQKSIRKRSDLNMPNPFENVSADDIKYPYHIEEQIIQSIKLHDIKMLDKSLELYISGVKSITIPLDNFRLYLLNFLLNVQRTLQSAQLSPEASKLLYASYFIKEISAAPTWHKMFALFEEYTSNLKCLLKTSDAFQKKCADNIEEYIMQNYNQKLSLNDLAEHFHFSVTYISRMFVRDKGITINTFINQYRIKKAVELIQTSNLPVKRIAKLVGYNNTSHFNRMIKQITNKSPADFRK